jgi:RNA polymerase sigma-70 factor (ECF subfamily)
MRIELLAQFEDLVGTSQRDIVNFHYRLVGNRAEAEDLAQETFIRAYKKFETLKEAEKARSWLYQIARNVTIDFFRKNGGREIPLDTDILDYYTQKTAVNHEVQLAHMELSREMAKCIDKLSKDEQLIVKLLYFEGFSYKQIADMLQINQNTLKSRLHRARQSLMVIIQNNQRLAGASSLT